MAQITIDIPDELLRAGLALLQQFVRIQPGQVRAHREPGDDDEPYDDRPPARQRPRADEQPGLEPQRGRSGGNGNGNGNGRGQRPQNGPPKTGKQLMGWLNKQPPEMFEQAKKLVRQWNYPTRFLDLHDSEAVELHAELSKGKPVSAGNNGYWGGNDAR
jgi:hypothetical protein